MRTLRVVGLLAVCACLTGCINSGTLIKVKADGSGTVEQTILMNMATLKGMMAGIDPKGQMQQQNTPFSEAQLKQMADKLGKGVRFVSSTPMSQGGFEGVKAIYAFDDINLVRIDQSPNISGSSDGRMSSATNSDPVTFKHARQGGNSVLTVSFNENIKTPAAPPANQPPPDAVDPAMMQMMKAMFQGFKVAIDLEVDGKIVKTDADYVNGSRITLLEIDMANLLEDEAKLRAIQTKVKPGATIAEVKPYLKDIKGVKINNSVVTVEYR